MEFLSPGGPTVKLPPGITPPRKAIVGRKVVNGVTYVQWSYYTTYVPPEMFNANGNDMSGLSSLPIVEEDPDVIDINTYIKEQLEVIEKEKELVLAISNIDIKVNGAKMLFLMAELDKTTAKRNFPSKDWKK